MSMFDASKESKIDPVLNNSLPAQRGDLIQIADMNEFNSIVLQNPLPVLVDFYADWCGPCRVIAPLVADAAKQYSGKMVFAKVDVDKLPEAAASFGVMSIPTLIFLSAGRETSRIVGAVSKKILLERVENQLDKDSI